MFLGSVYLILFKVAAVIYVGSLASYFSGKHCWAGRGLLLALFVHTLSQVDRCWRYGFFTLEGVFHAGYFLPWCLAALIVFGWYKHQMRILSALLPLSAIMVLVIMFPPECHHPKPFTPTWSAYLFFVTEDLAHACFVLSGWLALLFLRGRIIGQKFNVYAVWGFVFYSIAQLTGCVWSYLGWGVLFSWGTRHLHSAAIWCCYCSYIHTTFLKGFSPRKKAYFAMISSFVVIILFYGLPLIDALYKSPNTTTVHQQQAGRAANTHNHKELL